MVHTQNKVVGQGYVFQMHIKYRVISMHTPQLVYPFFHCWTLGLFPPFVCFEQRCREHMCICLRIYFYFFWVYTREWDCQIIYMVLLRSTFWELSHFFIAIANFSSPLAMYEIFCFSASSPTLIICSFFKLQPFYGCGVVPRDFDLKAGKFP